MSAAAAAPALEADARAPAKKGRKKLIVIAAAALLLLAATGGGAAVYLKKRAAQAAEAAENTEGSGAQAAGHSADKPDLKHPPTFLPLDPFVVNLADREADRYAQIGLTFEVEDAKFAEQMKAFMPAIRNGILMILAHKDSRELLDRSGKERLAAEVVREASRTMGIAVAEPAAAAAADRPAAARAATDDVDDDDAPARAAARPAPKKKPVAAPAEPNPIRRVHFSNFIVQ